MGGYKIMQSTKNFLYAIILIILLILSACLQEQGTLSTSSIYTEKTKHTEDTKYTDTDKVENTELTESTEHTEHTGQIYLYGEIHGVAKILDKEFELWCDYYQNDNMRYLFVERGYFTAEFLNLWMQSDNDAILDELYNDLEGTPSYNNDSKEFYKRIKSSCPETVFHGTDVGHLYYSTGKRYLKYLRKNGMKDSEQYKLAQDAIQQGEFFRNNEDDVYRENMMVKNFRREFDSLDGESIMGIYGAAHTGLDAMDFTNRVPCMANKLQALYGSIIHSEDLIGLVNEPVRVDTIEVNAKNYIASYFGKQSIWWSTDYIYREFWRLENAYNDFKENPKTTNVLPYNNYIMDVEIGQVFVIDYTKTDGSILRKFHRSDGLEWQDDHWTEEFSVK